jgi:hypothetical protein
MFINDGPTRRRTFGTENLVTCTNGRFAVRIFRGESRVVENGDIWYGSTDVSIYLASEYLCCLLN